MWREAPYHAQANEIRAKALRDLDAVRRRRPPASLPPLRGFRGTFVTPAGRPMGAAALCAAVERLARRPGELADGVGGGALQDPRLPPPRFISCARLEAMRERLCPAKGPSGARPPMRPVWLEQRRAEAGGWVDVERPWATLSAAAQLKKMRGMYDRCDARVTSMTGAHSCDG